LVHLDRNRYSVPTEYAHQIVSLRSYPTYISLVADGAEIARHPTQFRPLSNRTAGQPASRAATRKSSPKRQKEEEIDAPE